MAGVKVKAEVELRDYHLAFLRDQMAKYDIPDEGKALRVLLDYALVDGDLERIFHKRHMRCVACGGAAG